MSDFLEQHLADLPAIVDVPTLASKCGCGVGAIYQRSRRARADSKPDLLPEPLVVPGGNGLLFSRAAVVEWFRAAVRQQSKKPGRPRGALSRRGIGREALEARLVEEKGQ